MQQPQETTTPGVEPPADQGPPTPPSADPSASPSASSSAANAADRSEGEVAGEGPSETNGSSASDGGAASPPTPEADRDATAADPGTVANADPGAVAGATSITTDPGSAKPKRKRRRRRKGGAKTAAGDAPAAEGTESDDGTSEEGAEEESPSAGDGTTAPAKHSKPAAPAAAKAAADKAKTKRNRAKAGGKRSFVPRERIAFPVGEEVFGKVTSVTEHAIMVDLSGKALAIFDRGELAADDLVPDAGDRFVAHVHGDGGRGGLVVLTRKPLREEDAKPRVEAAAKSGEHVLGLVTGVVKGGVEVDIDGLRAFAPASHVDMRLGADLAYLIGQRFEFTVAQYEHRGRDVVVSRKAEVEAEAKESRKAALSKLELGSTVKGTVRTVLPFGMFVAIPTAEDVEGLVHVSEASHDRVGNLAELFKPGQEIDVKVLKIEKNGKLWLSHKATIPDPWDEARKTFAPGTRHKGKVMRLQPFGAFIEVAPGIEGLLHISDLSIKKIEHPKELLKEGDEIDVVVADFDRSSERISLHPAPPAGEENEPRQKVAPHKSVKVVVVVTEPGGIIVRVIGVTGRQARGYIPAGQTGTERGTDLRRHFAVGTKLDAKVIDVDARRGEAKLSLRAYKEDTEKAAYNEYRQSVAKASKFGTLGDLLAKKLSS